MNVHTYSSVQMIKYALKARQTTAVKMFKLKDPKYSPVDRHICVKLRSAAAKYKQRQRDLQVQRLARLSALSVKSKGESKTGMKKKLVQRQEANYAKHLNVEAMRVEKGALTDKLTQLCAKKRKM